jgi:hypothetical protein
MPSLADFDLKQKLGAGSFGTVYKAIRKSDGKPVVVKQVRAGLHMPAYLCACALGAGVWVQRCCKCLALLIGVLSPVSACRVQWLQRLL